MKILSIQYVRGLAALLVVIGHNSAFLGDYWANHISGALGEDVFFIVNGFIMTFITRRPPGLLIQSDGCEAQPACASPTLARQI